MFKKLSIRKKIVVGFSVVSALSLFYIINLLSVSETNTNQSNNPTPTPISKIQPNNPIINNTRIKETVLSPGLIFPDIPTNLHTYKVEPIDQSPNQIQSAISKEFGLSSPKNPGGPWSSTDKSTNMFVSGKNIVLKVDSYAKPGAFFGQNKPEVKEIGQLATNLLNKTGLNLNTISQSQNITYLRTDLGHTQAATESTYNLLGVNFSTTLDNIPVKTNNNTSYPIQIIFGQKNQVVEISIEIDALFSVTEKTPVSNTKSRNEILEEIKSGKYSTIDIEILTPKQSELGIDRVTLSSAQVLYRYDTSLKSIKPYIEFTGNFFTDKYSSGSITTLVDLATSAPALPNR